MRILSELNRNARLSYRQMAKELNVSMSTISNRVRNMENKGIIKGYVPILDPLQIGFDLMVIIGVRISKGNLLGVQNEISKNPNVFGVYDITGDWDSIIEARFRNRAELNKFIKWLVSIENVERSYTQIVLNVVKEEAIFHEPIIGR